MKIYDNFLSSEEFKEITDFVYGDDILWEETIKVPGDDSEDNFQYVHIAYCDMTPISHFYNMSWSVLSRVKPIAIHKIKINMEPNTIIFLLPKSELKKTEYDFLRKLYKSQDIALMLKHDRKIIEWFWKISMEGEVLEIIDEKPKAVNKQLQLPVIKS